MLNQALIVVSDKFHHFATRKNVITISELHHLLTSKTVVFQKLSMTHLIPGQGFSEQDIENIIHLAQSSINSKYFDASMWKSVPKRASSELTHKHKAENILISDPKRHSQTEFYMDVLIDENCEMMHDHQTGLHVQGMILVEAARQACMSTIEKFLLDDIEKKLYFVFNKLTVNYNRFSFPLPATLKLTLKKSEASKKDRRHYALDVDVIQCGNISASLYLDGIMMPDNRVLNMESRLANQSLDNYLNQAIMQNTHNVSHMEVEHA